MGKKVKCKGENMGGIKTSTLKIKTPLQFCVAVTFSTNTKQAHGTFFNLEKNPHCKSEAL